MVDLLPGIFAYRGGIRVTPFRSLYDRSILTLPSPRKRHRPEETPKIPQSPNPGLQLSTGSRSQAGRRGDDIYQVWSGLPARLRMKAPLPRKQVPYATSPARHSAIRHVKFQSKSQTVTAWSG